MRWARRSQVLIERGGVAGDFPVDLEPPRQRGSADFARIEAAILEHPLNPA